MTGRIIAIGALGALVSGAHAVLLQPNLLKNSVDGPDKNLQAVINGRGYTSSVGTQNGNTIVDYGDQVAQRLFVANRPMEWSIAWQFAGQKAWHRIGYYTNVNGDRPEITWVIGGSHYQQLNSNDPNFLPGTRSVNLSGVFGLAFDSGDKKGNGQSTIYFSEAHRNADGRNLLAVLNERDRGGQLVPGGLLLSWEDKPSFDLDYNDFGLRLEAEAVPEPATLLALGLGAALVARRRRRV